MMWHAIPPQEFLDPEEVRRVSKIEILDEVEEWELIMVRRRPHYLPYLDVMAYVSVLHWFPFVHSFGGHTLSF